MFGARPKSRSCSRPSTRPPARRTARRGSEFCSRRTASIAASSAADASRAISRSEHAASISSCARRRRHLRSARFGRRSLGARRRLQRLAASVPATAAPGERLSTVRRDRGASRRHATGRSRDDHRERTRRTSASARRPSQTRSGEQVFGADAAGAVAAACRRPRGDAKHGGAARDGAGLPHSLRAVAPDPEAARARRRSRRDPARRHGRRARLVRHGRRSSARLPRARRLRARRACGARRAGQARGSAARCATSTRSS